MSFITRQPNGKLCRFSTVVDTITDYNMTEDRYIEMCAEQARDKARREIANIRHPFEDIVTHFWPHNHTVGQFNNILKNMGSDLYVKEEDYKE